MTRTREFIGTFQNTIDGNQSYKALRKSMQMYCKNNNLRFSAYGRGPRRKTFEKRAQDPNSWEYGKKWNNYLGNNCYRPKLVDSTHFDVYLNKK